MNIVSQFAHFTSLCSFRMNSSVLFQLVRLIETRKSFKIIVLLCLVCIWNMKIRWSLCIPVNVLVIKLDKHIGQVLFQCRVKERNAWLYCIWPVRYVCLCGSLYENLYEGLSIWSIYESSKYACFSLTNLNGFSCCIALHYLNRVKL